MALAHFNATKGELRSMTESFDHFVSETASRLGYMNLVIGQLMRDIALFASATKESEMIERVDAIRAYYFCEFGPIPSKKAAVDSVVRHELSDQKLIESFDHYTKLAIDDAEKKLRRGAIDGDLESCKAAIASGARKFHDLLSWSASKAHIHIIEFARKFGIVNWNLVMEYAAKGDHMELVRIAIENGATSFQGAFEQAAIEGNIEMCDFMRGAGARFSPVTRIYARKNAKMLAHLIHDFGKMTDDDMRDISGIPIECCEILLSANVAGANVMLASAARYNRCDVCRLAREHGANDFHAMLRATPEYYKEARELAFAWIRESECECKPIGV